MTTPAGGEPDAAPRAASAPLQRPKLRLPILLAGLLAVLPFVATLAWPSGNLLRAEAYGGFYDAQAHSLLHGHWSVDPKVVAIEGYTTPRGTQIYFGPVPAVARMPIAALTHRFDGRLTRPSMILAELVLAAALIRIADWLAILLPGEGARRARRLTWLQALVVFTTAASLPLVIAGWAWVYNEAIMWGAALATAALWMLVAHLATGRLRPLVGSAALAVLATMTRASVGLGPLMALLLLGLQRYWALRPRRSNEVNAPGERASALSTIATALAALAVAGGLYMGVNIARFGTPLRVPYEQQTDMAGNAARRAALKANGDNLNSLSYLPTQLLQAIRPDALRIHSMFPFVTLPRGDAPLVVPATFESRRASNSLLTSAPLPFLLMLLGAAASFAPRGRFRQLGARRVELRPLILGALAGTSGFLTFADIAPRYLGDAIPLLAIGGLTGSLVLAGWRVGTGAPDAAARPSHTRTAAAAIGAGLLCLSTTWVNIGFASQTRFDQSTSATFTESRQWARLQLAASHLVGGYPPAWAGRVLTRGPEPGSLAILGDCTGLYRATDQGWIAIEGAPGIGEAVVEASPASTATGRDLLTKRDDLGEIELRVEPDASGHADLLFTSYLRGAKHRVSLGEIPWKADEPQRLHVLLDHRTGDVRVVSGEGAVVGIRTYVPSGSMQPGTGVKLASPGDGLCARLNRDLHRAGR